MKIAVTKGTTSRLLEFVMRDSSTGAPKSGITYSAVTIKYTRQGASSETTVSGVTMTAGSWASGGWVEFGTSGKYQFGIPNAVLASGANEASVTIAATGAITKEITIQLSSVDLQDAVRAGMSALPNAAPGAANGLQICGSNAATTYAALTITGCLTINSDLNINGNTVFANSVRLSSLTVVGETSLANLTAGNITADGFQVGGVAIALAGDKMDLVNAPNGTAIAAIQSGLATAAAVSALQTSVNNLNNLSALANIFGPPILEIPDAGNTLFPFTLTIRDSEGHLVDADATPTITATNAAGTDRSANLSAVTHPATGRYNFTYSVANNATREGLRIEATCNVGASARYAIAAASVEDYDTITSIGAIKAKTDLIATNAADSPNAVTAQGNAAAVAAKLPAGGANIGDATAASQTAILAKFPANFSAVTIPANGTLSVTVAAYATGMAPLQPTVAGRTLNVAASGQAGINWSDIANQGAPVNLANTTIPGTGGGGSGGLTPTQNTALLDIQAKVTAIGASPVTVYSPVAPTGDVTLIRGDDYKAADARAITFGASGFDFTGATVQLLLTPFGCRNGTATTIDGAFVGATASFDIPSDITSALAPGDDAYLYQLVTTLADNSVVTLARGSVNVLDPTKG